MFSIRNFGNDTTCVSVLDLKEKLVSKYAGFSVSIQYRTKIGMLKVVHVDVSHDGHITETYGDQKCFDFDSLSLQALKMRKV
ncbi:hypothetical protein [Vibrio cincinnatiensis]|uniref:hypothetical protein n=1 Tax=Vibrio cincinnatiensis TaxID=675 RepID=UPI001EE0EB27|nr:hypothetical protein [Vibrio cincinnatiensis]MCG3741183.1 hypothetical protein [Vibrio cincinnatiensis]